MTTFWNQKTETMSRDELASCQLARLRQTVKRVYERNPFYHSKMEQAGVKPADIEVPEDLRIHVQVQPGVTGFMVEKHLKEKLGFSPKGDVFPPGTLARQEGKAKRVFFGKAES